MQSLPPGSLPSCGAPLDVLFKFSPCLEVIRKVLTGSGECGEVNWRFLGLAMPAWVLLVVARRSAALGLRANLRRAAACSTPTYMRCRASMSATRTYSLTLWMLALTTPSSTTCAPRGAMKRPSEVPPPVESLGGLPATSTTASHTASESTRGRYRRARRTRTTRA